jgi:hypothetical protein
MKGYDVTGSRVATQEDKVMRNKVYNRLAVWFVVGLVFAWLGALFMPLSSGVDRYGYNRGIVLVGLDAVLFLIGVVSLVGACIRKHALRQAICVLGIPVVHAVGYFMPEVINTVVWLTGSILLCICLLAPGNEGRK